MGLKVLPVQEWIEPDDSRTADLALKEQLLKNHRSTVLAVHDEDLAGSAAIELHDLLWSHLQIYHGREKFSAPSVAPKTVADALEGTSRWVQEDFCLLSPIDYRLMAGIVCFPSRWKIPDKIGKVSDEIQVGIACPDGKKR